MEDQAEYKIASPKKEMRAVATIELYCYGYTDAELIESAKQICADLNNKLDCHADVTELVEQPFATFISRKITL